MQRRKLIPVVLTISAIIFIRTIETANTNNHSEQEKKNNSTNNRSIKNNNNNGNLFNTSSRDELSSRLNDFCGLQNINTDLKCSKVYTHNSSVILQKKDNETMKCDLNQLSFENKNAKHNFTNNNETNIQTNLNNNSKNYQKNSKPHKNLWYRFLSFLPFINKLIKHEFNEDIPENFKDTFTKTMMGRACILYRPHYLILNKSTITEKLNEGNDPFLHDLLLHSSIICLNKNSIQCEGITNDPKTKESLIDPILINFSCIRFGCKKAKELAKNKEFKDLGFSITEDNLLTEEIKKYVKKKGIATPKKYSEINSKTIKELLDYQKESPNTIIDTNQFIGMEQSNVKNDNSDSKNKMGDFNEKQKKASENEEFLEKMGNIREYYEDLSVFLINQ